MSGPLKGTVTLNNTRIFMAAILGILMENAPHVDRKHLKPVSIGMINKYGDIFLTRDDMVFLKKTFKQMKANRALYDLKLEK